MVDRDNVKLCDWVESLFSGSGRNSREKFTVAHHKEALARWPLQVRPSDVLPPLDDGSDDEVDEEYQSLEAKLVKAVGRFRNPNPVVREAKSLQKFFNEESSMLGRLLHGLIVEEEADQLVTKESRLKSY